MYLPPGIAISILIAVLAVLAAAIWIVGRERLRTERRARNLRALFEVSRQATANLDQQQVLEIVVQAVQDVMGYQMASVLLLDESRQELVSMAISSNLRGRIPVGDRIPLHRGMVGAAARSGRTQLANDVARNPDYIRAPGAWDPGSELSVPLLSGGRVVGVLDAQAEARGAFSQENVQALESLAEQLAVILEKARLFELERSRAERTAALAAIGRLLAASLSLDALLRTAVVAMNEQLHYADIALLMVDSERPDLLVLSARSGVYAQFVP
jgi:GAF domain-containing protein